MAGKFEIFCDETQQPIDHNTNQRDATTTGQAATALLQLKQQRTLPLQDLKLKREPLVTRQTATHHTIQTQPLQQQTFSQKTSSQTSTTTTSTTTHNVITTNDQATANISTSSSLINVSISEDQENDISMASLGSDFVPSILHESDRFDEGQSFEFEEDEDEEAAAAGLSDNSDLMIKSDEEDELDEEDIQEIIYACKKSEDSLLFKAANYIDDIDSYCHKLERNVEWRALPGYMDLQPNVDSKKRYILTNWLIEVSDEFNLQTETLFITIDLVDRYLSKMSVETSKLQLLGVAAMFIASKYEEIYPPELYSFVEVTDETYSGLEIRKMEIDILKALDFKLAPPSSIFFLKRIFAFNKFPKKVYDLAEFLCHLALLEDYPFLEYYPSEIALSAVILAANQLGSGDQVSADIKREYDQANYDQADRRKLPRGVKRKDIDRRSFTMDGNLPLCIESLLYIQEKAYRRSGRYHKDSALLYKFSLDTYNSVALIPPPAIEDLCRY